ncbi:hypothetical protein AB5I41_08965 [Sphingomonas sp. MMS24-JH45]
MKRIVTAAFAALLSAATGSAWASPSSSSPSTGYAPATSERPRNAA